MKKTRLISAILVAVMIFWVCSTTALAYEETQSSKSFANNSQSHNQIHESLEETEMIYLETADDFLKGGFESLYIPDNVKITTNAKSEDVISAIKSSESFDIDGIISKAEQSMDINEYYDFSTSSRFDIAKWAKKAEIITEAEMIECYCDLFIDRNFENTSCLTCVVAEIQDYQENNVVSAELGKKIDEVMTPPFESSSSNSENTRATPDYTTEATYSSANFTIHYDGSANSTIDVEIAALYATYFEEFRAIYHSNYGFRYPLLETNETKYHVYLSAEPDPNPDPEDGSLAAGVAVRNFSLLNTCSSYIVLYNQPYNLQGQNQHRLKCLIAHEYFHATQFAYNKCSREDNNWFVEANASFVALILNKYPLYHIDDVFEFFRTNQPISETKGYGALVFPATIYREYGGMSAIRSIYEEYNERLSNLVFPSVLRNIITDGIQKNGYADETFETAYLKMAIYTYRPNYWYESIWLHTPHPNWTINFDTQQDTDTYICGNYIKTVDYNSITSFTDSTSYLTNKYYQINFPDDLLGYVKITVNFDGNDGYLQAYASKNNSDVELPNDEPIVYSPVSQDNSVASITISNVGTGVNDVKYVGFVISNLSASGILSYTVTLEVEVAPNSFVDWNYERFKELRIYIAKNGYSEYNIYFPIAGNKIFQTFGEMDTMLSLYDSSGNLVASNDDSGYSRNALISYSVNAESWYKLRVEFYDKSKVGETKVTLLTAPAISSYEDLFEGVQDWVSYRASPQQYNVAISQLKVTTSRTFTFTTSCKYDAYMDTFMYIIDPRSVDIATPNGNASIYDDNSAGNNQATITKTFDANVPYMLIVCLEDPSSETGTTHIYVSKTEI